MPVSITKQLAVVEDLALGVGVVTQERMGILGTYHELNGSYIPYSATLSLNEKIQSLESGTSQSQQHAWVSEAWERTSKSYASQPEDELVRNYTSNGDGTFTIVEVPNAYSSLHWRNKAENSLDLQKWEAQALAMTAQSYAMEPAGTFVKVYTSNGDGTFTYTDTTDISAYASALASFSSAEAAALSETNAKASEDASALSETNAKASEDASALSETNAKTSEDASALSETNAKASEDAAAISETNASDSATETQLAEWRANAWEKTAQSYAMEDEDVFVKMYTSNGDGTFSSTDTTDYSAKHWQIKALAAMEDKVDKAGDTMTGTLDAPNVTVNGTDVWTADNDGSGSGLDADTLDGAELSAIARKIDYSTNTVGGTIKSRYDSATKTLYLTTDGSDA